MPGHNGLYVGRSRLMSGGAYTSPFLLEILSSKNQGAWPVATGSLKAEAPGLQTVSCSRAASAYCLGNDGLLHLLGANTVRVEPAGLLVEGASTNQVQNNTTPGGTGWSLQNNGPGNIAVTLNSTDVLDPAGGNTASRFDIPAVVGGQFSIARSTGTLGAPGTFSVYVRTASGTYSGWMSNTGGTASVNYTATTTWQRVTMASGNDALDIGTNSFATGGPTSVAGTVYVWMPQGEALPFCTSPIATGAAAATRDADIVTVANPLNPSNPGTWRAGVSVAPLAPWASYPAQFPSVLSSPPAYPGANGWWHYLNSGVSTGTFDTFDATTAQRFTQSTLSPTASDPYALLLRDVAGTLSVFKNGSLVSGANSGAGTGVIATQNATLQVGGGQGGVNIGYWHLTDILVDNT